jgi:N-acetylmuramoyl-L-alanine amidase
VAICRIKEALWVALFLLMANSQVVTAEISAQAPTQRLIIVDPGHGGDDLGARGHGGSLEKEITLRMAYQLSEKLSLRYRVKLSREIDRRPNIIEITGMANENNANLFISLHVGNSFAHCVGGILLYHYQAPGQGGFNLSHDSERLSDYITDYSGRWQGVQLKHISKSRQLSKSIENRIRQTAELSCQTDRADAMVLSGADMPAVLIEFGCLASGEEEKKMNDSKYLGLVSTAISEGITDFLEGNVPISSMDLHQ